MTNWLNDAANIPGYCNHSRVIFFSKEDNVYPAKGNVRTIAIINAIFKLFE